MSFPILPATSGNSLLTAIIVFRQAKGFGQYASCRNPAHL